MHRNAKLFFTLAFLIIIAEIGEQQIYNRNERVQSNTDNFTNDIGDEIEEQPINNKNESVQSNTDNKKFVSGVWYEGISVLISQVTGSIGCDARELYTYSDTFTVITHKLTFTPTADSEIRIYSPEDWDYSHMNYNIGFTEGSTYDYFSGVAGITYEIYYTSNSYNYLTIKDVTDKYLTDVSFETGDWRHDWGYSTNYFQKIEVRNNGITSDGQFSLYLERTSGYAAISLYAWTLPDGFYYFSFDVYFTLNDGNPTMFFFGDESKYVDMTGYSTYRWHRIFIAARVYAQVDEIDIIRFRTNTGNVYCYFDNFRIYKSSTSVETLGLNSINIKTTLRNFDGYKNPAIPKHNISLVLRDVTNPNSVGTAYDSVIERFDTLTNENGQVSLFYDYTFDIKQYSVIAFAPDSRFMCPWTEEDMLNPAYWDGGYVDYYADMYDDFTNSMCITWRGAASHSYLAYLVFDITGTWDMRAIDYVYIEIMNFPGTSGTFDGPLLAWGKLRLDLVRSWATKYVRTYIDVPQSTYPKMNKYAQYIANATIGSDVSDDFTTVVGKASVTKIQLEMKSDESLGSDDFIVTYVRVFAGAGDEYFFTPIPVSYENYFNNNLFDFTPGDRENLTLGSSMTQVRIEEGRLFATESATYYNSLIAYKYDAVSIDCSYYNYLIFRARLKYAYATKLYRWELETLSTSESTSMWDTEFWYSDYISGDDNNWHTYIVNLNANTNYRSGYKWNSDFSVLTNIIIYNTADSGHAGWEEYEIDYIAFVHVEEPEIYAFDSYFVYSSTNNTFLYEIYSDSVFLGYYSDLEMIPKNMTAGDHNITAVLFSDSQNDSQNKAYIPSTYEYLYTITESGIMKIIIHDQLSNSLTFDNFKVYIDSQRLYDQYVYFEDTSQTFNLTITDLFDNLLYQNTTEAFEQFKEIQLTLYSVKIQNLQFNPVFIRLERGEKYYQEWIFSYEIVEYMLEEATYTFYVYYSDVSSDFTVSTNGTIVSYNYYINDDTAIRITGRSIEDVWGNVIDLSNDLDAVNASITNQIVSVNITVSNVNNSISNQIVDVNIYIDNVNNTLSNQLISLQTDVTNVNVTLYQQTVQILTDLYNVNSTLFDQTVTILSDISNVNSTLYSQTLSILSSISNVNSTLYEQTVTILSNLSNVNSTLYSQTLTILSNIQNVNSTLYSQTVTILSDIQNSNC